jgi:Uncharacterized conserved protein
MKIAIPVIDNNEHKYDIANGFNSTGSLCLYNEASGNFFWMRTSDLACNMGELLPALISQEVDSIITKHIHPMALQVLVNKGFRVYQSEGVDLMDNINLFNGDKLQTYDFVSSFADIQICGGECSVCSTECDEK